METIYCWLLEEFKDGNPQSRWVQEGNVNLLTTDPYKALRFHTRENAERAIGPSVFVGTQEIHPVEHGFDQEKVTMERCCGG